MPRDAMLQANLEFVLTQREDKAVQQPIPWPLSLGRDLFRWLSLNEWILVTAFLYLTVCTLALVVVLGRRRAAMRVALSVTSVLLLTAGTTLAFKVHEERAIERGVVSSERVSVMSGPGQDYTVEFWLHTGTEVEVEVRRPEWLRISVGDLRGWIPTSAVVDI